MTRERIWGRPAGPARWRFPARFLTRRAIPGRLSSFSDNDAAQIKQRIETLSTQIDKSSCPRGCKTCQSIKSKKALQELSSAHKTASAKRGCGTLTVEIRSTTDPKLSAPTVASWRNFLPDAEPPRPEEGSSEERCIEGRWRVFCFQGDVFWVVESAKKLLAAFEIQDDAEKTTESFRRAIEVVGQVNHEELEKYMSYQCNQKSWELFAILATMRDVLRGANSR